MCALWAREEEVLPCWSPINSSASLLWRAQRYRSKIPFRTALLPQRHGHLLCIPSYWVLRVLYHLCYQSSMFCRLYVRNVAAVLFFFNLLSATAFLQTLTIIFGLGNWAGLPPVCLLSVSCPLWSIFIIATLQTQGCFTFQNINLIVTCVLKMPQYLFLYSGSKSCAACGKHCWVRHEYNAVVAQ